MSTRAKPRKGLVLRYYWQRYEGILVSFAFASFTYASVGAAPAIAAFAGCMLTLIYLKLGDLYDRLALGLHESAGISKLTLQGTQIIAAALIKGQCDDAPSPTGETTSVTNQ